MKSACLAGAGTAMLVAFSIGAFAQEKPQSPPSAPPSATRPAAAADQQISVTGCVQREADYRKAQNLGKGGPVGTGIGAGDEFILAQASTSGAAGAPAPVGTAGSSAAFELTGANEKDASQYVGKRVEIMGKLKAAETDAAGRPTGGPTAGKPPAGVDIAGGDLKLRELEVVSIKETSGTCAK